MTKEEVQAEYSRLSSELLTRGFWWGLDRSMVPENAYYPQVCFTNYEDSELEYDSSISIVIYDEYGKSKRFSDIDQVLSEIDGT